MFEFDFDPALWMEIMQLPGSTTELIMDLRKRDFFESLSNQVMSISDQDGICVNNRSTAPELDTIKIQLPADKTVGHLIEAVMACPAPALILVKLTINARANEALTTYDHDKIDGLTRVFLNALRQAEGDEAFRALLSLLPA